MLRLGGVLVEWRQDELANLRLRAGVMTVDLHQRKALVFESLHRVRHLVARLGGLNTDAVISLVYVFR